MDNYDDFTSSGNEDEEGSDLYSEHLPEEEVVVLSIVC